MRQNYTIYALLLLVVMACQGKPIDERSDVQGGTIDQKPDETPDFLKKGFMGSTQGAVIGKAGQISQAQVVNSATIMPDDSILVSFTTANYELTAKRAHFVKKILPAGGLDPKFSIELEGDGQFLAASATRVFVATNHFEFQCVINQYDMTGKLLDEQITLHARDCGKKYGILDIKFVNGLLYVLSYRKEISASSSTTYYYLAASNPENGVPASGWPQSLGTKDDRFTVLADGRVAVFSSFDKSGEISHYSADGKRSLFYKFPSASSFVNGFRDVSIDANGNHYVALSSSSSVLIHKILADGQAAPSPFPVTVSDFAARTANLVLRDGGGFGLLARKFPTVDPIDPYAGSAAIFAHFSGQGILQKKIDLSRNGGLPDFAFKQSDKKLVAIGSETSVRARRDSDIYKTIFLDSGAIDKKESIDWQGPGNDGIRQMVHLLDGDFLVSGFEESASENKWWLSRLSKKEFKPFVLAKAIPESGTGPIPFLSQVTESLAYIAIQSPTEVSVYTTASDEIRQVPLNSEEVVDFQTSPEGNMAFLVGKLRTRGVSGIYSSFKVKTQVGTQNYNIIPTALNNISEDRIGLAIHDESVYTAVGSSTDNTISIQKHAATGEVAWQKSYVSKCSATWSSVDSIVKKDNGILVIGRYQPRSSNSTGFGTSWWILGVDEDGTETIGWNLCANTNGVETQQVAGVWTPRRFYLTLLTDHTIGIGKNMAQIFSFNHIGRSQVEETISIKGGDRYIEATSLLEKDDVLTWGGLTSAAHHKWYGSTDSLILQFDVKKDE